MRGLYTLGAFFASMAIASTAHASVNLLINGSLETSAAASANSLVYVSPRINKNALLGWKITSGTVDVVPSSYWQSALDTYSVDMVGTNRAGSIRQTVVTHKGDTYGLTFDFSVNPEMYGGENGTTKILQVKALAPNGKVLASQLFSDTDGSRTNGDMQWAQKSFQFVANNTKATIVITALTPTNLPHGITPAKARCGPVIDNLDLQNLTSGQQSVPEPASLAVLGIGGLLLLRRRRLA